MTYKTSARASAPRRVSACSREQQLALASVAREIGRDVDPDAVFEARQVLRVGIRERLGSVLSTVYERLDVGGGYSPDAKSAGRRALRNIALDLLAAGVHPEGIARAKRQYEQADNMTERLAALATLSLYDLAESRSVLDDFYERYSSDALVVDKWFSLQAAMPHRKALKRVRSLTSHPAFSLTNPNRVRSLIGAFAQGNMTQFNRPDGAGYDFVAGIILELDARNPQISARLATSFRSWRMLEPGRRSKAEAALGRMRAAKSLSRDLSDILERTIADD